MKKKNVKLIKPDNKIFMEVKVENGEIIGIGKPFKIYGACRIESPEDIQIVCEEVEIPQKK